MEKYKDFLERISYQKAELQIGEGRFIPDGRVCEKVGNDNRFKPFFGDTVVFALEKRTQNVISEIIDKLYEIAPECFCERINTETIHITLHDLSASENLDIIASQVFRNEVKLLQIINSSPVKPQTIKMKANYIINMVSTSLVLALVPTDKSEWNKLQEIYDLINEVKVCGYPFLTPHITLAYFNYNGFDEAASQKLKSAVFAINQNSFALSLDTNKLFYQKFIGMNKYFSVFPLV